MCNMKIKKTDEYLIKLFWELPEEQLFDVRTVALILNMGESTLQHGSGPAPIKMFHRNVYRKRDVLEYMKSFEEKTE